MAKLKYFKNADSLNVRTTWPGVVQLQRIYAVFYLGYLLIRKPRTLQRTVKYEFTTQDYTLTQI
jgi:hypothetical protein